jgi:hypothetical protein
MPTNDVTIEAGFAKAKSIIRNKIQNSLVNDADLLAMKAHDLYHSPMMAFTGNAWTGTAVGVYIDYKLKYYVTTRMIAGMNPPVRRKLTSHEGVFLRPDYLGRNRHYVGVVETDKQHGESDAIQFLYDHTPVFRYGITVVSGVEYADFIERDLHGDVLTGTYYFTRNLRAVDLIR